MNGYTLKQELSGKVDTIQEILEKLGCHSFSNRTKGQLRFALPEHKNPTSGCVNTDNLFLTVFNDMNFKGDIIGFVSEMKKIPFGESIIFLCQLLDLDYHDEEYVEKPADYFDKFFQLIGKKYRKEEELTPFSHISSQYEFIPQLALCQEGITIAVQKQFHIGYDNWSKRILFPHRYYKGKKDEFVGIIGRTTIPQWEQLGLPKYFPLRKYKKSQNLYGYWENMHPPEMPKTFNENQAWAFRTFKKNKYVVVYEAEKSVLKRASVNDFTGVAICGHSLSQTQANILCGMNDVIEIVFAMDNDVDEAIVKDMCKMIWNKKTSYIIDKNKNDPNKRILGEKDSPADLDNKHYYDMFLHRIPYSAK